MESPIAAEEDSVADDNATRRAECQAFYATKCRPGFQDVTDYTAEQLLARNLASVLLVDCRADEEIAVSKLAGSVTQRAFDAGWVDMLAEGGGKEEVVMYCTIGGRSGAAAKAFGAKHPEVKVANFAGSLIEWAHAGGEVVDTEGQPTTHIHAWGPKFAAMMPQNVNAVV